MPLAGLVLNRVHRSPTTELIAGASAAAAASWTQPGEQPGRGRRAAGARGADRAGRTASSEVAARFTEAFPAVPVAAVAAQPADVHDVDGLRTIGAALSRL